MFLAAALLCSGASNLAAYLETQPNPVDYVVAKATSHRIVLLGEDHAIKQNLEFAAQLLPALDARGIPNFGMEFGAEEDQAALDALVTAPTYDEAEARRIMFHYNVGWAFREYREIYRAAWKLNHSKRRGKAPFRILNLSYVFDWKGYNGRSPASMERVFRRGPIEIFRRNIIKKQVLDKRERIVILTGTPHAFTTFQAPVFAYEKPHYVSFVSEDFGNLLYELAPSETFTILLNQPFWSADPMGKNVYPAGGALERAFRRPVGFDLRSTPTGTLPDSSWYSVGRKGFQLRKLADGFVMLAQIRQLQGCTVDRSFVTAADLPAVQRQWPDPDWHPVPKTVEDYYKVVDRFVDLQDRYASLPSIP